MENRSTHGKNPTRRRSPTAATNEHNPPTQYTRGADDEGAKTAKTTDGRAARGRKTCR